MDKKKVTYFPKPIKFEWDEGNSEKNWIKHQVSQIEAESIFFNRPIIFAKDRKHSATEARFFCIGKTNQDRHLFVSYTLRGKFIRIISVRDMTRREFQEYRRYEEKNS